ncbi:MAG: aminotransferase class I/II-fold pyridoxal phosphate-dependent enzyme [Ignavibacteriales bacterium]|nr:aminotransferase class I/II-fold pyridoxal phosphate-dependent enzyme [Ignavibacteriales bacterium]
MTEFDPKLFDNFLGPKGENHDLLKRLVNRALDRHSRWRAASYADDETLYPSARETAPALEKALDRLLDRAEESVPYFHPRYAAQMLKDPAIPTVLGYLAFMLANPNNHAYEGGPVTTEMETEVTDLLLRMVGFEEGWGHLASGGSLANLEALWAIRDSREEGAVYFSEVSHYSWKRICAILRIEEYAEIECDADFRIDATKLADALERKPAMAVVVNLGSTGTGSVDDLEAVLALRDRYGFHLHVDAAYGGFARAALIDGDYRLVPESEDVGVSAHTRRQLAALGRADSITVDPHKLGLISYGAGAVVYRHERLRRAVLNTAPYTYHKKDKPNIGMFSLEGSRPGAMAAACWLTYQVLPPNRAGVGLAVRASIAAAREFRELIEEIEEYVPLHAPDLDIVCFYRRGAESTVASANEATLAIYERLSVEAKDPPFVLSKFVAPASIAAKAAPELDNPSGEPLSALRVVFMKHWHALDEFRYVRELIDVLRRTAR